MCRVIVPERQSRTFRHRTFFEFCDSKWTILSVLLLCIMQFGGVEASARVFINFQSYQNPASLQYDGNCCDGELIGGNCTGVCDYSMTACLGQNVSFPCEYVRVNLGHLESQSTSFTFPAIFPDGLANPAPLNLQIWPGSALITIYVYDQDTAGRQLVDFFQFSFNMTSPVRERLQQPEDFTDFELSGRRSELPSTMVLSVTTRCDSFFYTDTCQVNCVPANDCNGHYTCNTTNGDKICIEGWGGPDCSNQLSENLTCSNEEKCSGNGTCVSYGDQADEYYCCCDQGYAGDNCRDDIDECASFPCLHNGVCVQEKPPNYRCECYGRWKGQNCELAVTCADDPCQNSGTCVPLGPQTEFFFCNCNNVPFSDEFCQTPLPTTTTSTTTTTPSPSTTTSTTPGSTASVTPGQGGCFGSYYGADCLTYCRAADDCSGHYTCNPNTGDKICLPGWTQESNCTAPAPPVSGCECQNDGQCFQGGCCCTKDFTGPLCTSPSQFCSNSPCMNGGICFEDSEGARCACREMFTGQLCETMLYPNRNCPEDYYGQECDVYCKPQFACGLEVGRYYCDERTGDRVCMFGWTGPNCDQIDPNARHEDPCPASLCRNSAICLNDTCCCMPGFTGTLCHIEILECDSSPCLNDGICVDLINAYSCLCKPGFSGPNCEAALGSTDVTTSAPGSRPCDNTPCQNGGTCLDNGAEDFICLCPDRCVGPVCEIILPLGPSNQACPPNYYGPDCTVMCTEENSCAGHYYCNADSGERVCMSGWNGTNCENRWIPEVLDPECPNLGGGCVNGGSCFNDTCCCVSPYQGSRCEAQVLTCQGAPCGDNGVCVDTGSAFFCQCTAEYSGFYCETFIGVTGINVTGSVIVSNTASNTATISINPSQSSVAEPSLSVSITPTSVASNYGLVTSMVSSSISEQTTTDTPLIPCGEYFCFNGGECSVTNIGSICRCPRQNMGQYCLSTDSVTGSTSISLSLPSATTATTIVSSSSTLQTGMSFSTQAISDGTEALSANEMLTPSSQPMDIMSSFSVSGGLGMSTTLTTQSLTETTFLFTSDMISIALPGTQATSSSLADIPGTMVTTPVSEVDAAQLQSTRTVDVALTEIQSTMVFPATTGNQASVSPDSVSDVTMLGSGTTATSPAMPTESTLIAATITPSLGEATETSLSSSMAAVPPVNTFAASDVTSLSMASSTASTQSANIIGDRTVTFSEAQTFTVMSTEVTPTPTADINLPVSSSITDMTTSSTTSSSVTDIPPSVKGEFYITGPISPADFPRLQILIEECLRLYSLPALDCCYTVTVFKDQRYFGVNGILLFRVEYEYTPNGPSTPGVDEDAMLSLVDERLNSTAEFARKNNQVYRGSTYGPDVTFELFLIGDIIAELYDEIAGIIMTTWVTRNPNCACIYNIRVFFGERYSGLYGTRLTKIYYIVTKDNVLQSVTSPERPSTSDFMTSFKDGRSFYTVYLSDDGVPYNRHFDLTLNEVVILTSQRGISVVTSLTNSWTQYFLSDGRLCSGTPCNVVITTLRPELHYTDTGTDLSNLVYFLTVNGVRQRPEVYSNVSLQIETITTTEGWTSCGCRHSNMHYVYVYGYAQYFQAMSVIQDIIGEGDGGAVLIDRHFFIDPYGALVTKIIFKPTVYDDQRPMQSVAEIQDILSQYQFVHPHPGTPFRQRYEIVIEGQVSSDDNTTIHDVLTQSWMENNPDISPDDLFVFIITMDSETYIRVDGSPVTVVHYYVSIGPADSSLTVAEEPSLDKLTQNFINSGSMRLCGCQVRIKMFITVTGDLDPSNSGQTELIEQSLEEAWREANQNYTGDLNVNVTSISSEVNDTAGGSGGQEQEQIIYFTIELVGGQEEVSDRDLQQPSDEVTNIKFQENAANVTTGRDGQSSSATTAMPTSTSSPESTSSPVESASSTAVTPTTESTVTGTFPTTISGEVFITGPVAPEDVPQLQELIENCLRNYSQPDVGCCYTVVVFDDQRYFDANGNLLVRVEYEFTPNDSVRPTVDRDAMLTYIDQRLNSKAEFVRNSNQVYRGSTYGPEVTFELFLIGDITVESYPDIATTLQQTWVISNPNCACLYNVTIFFGERYSGVYGTWLTKIYYIVMKNEIVLPATSSERPTMSDLTTSLKDSVISYTMYLNDDALSYRRHFDLTINEVLTLTSQRGVDVITNLTNAWRQYFLPRECPGDRCSVVMESLRPELHYTDDGTEVSNLVYFLNVNGEVQRPEVHSDVSIETIIAAAWSSCQCRHSHVHSLYVYGYAQYFQAMSVLQDIIGQEYGGGEIIDRQFFRDSFGTLVTKIIFKPTIYVDQLPMRSATVIRDILSPYQFFQPPPGTSLSQRYEIVLDGQFTADNTAFIQNILTQSWRQTNTGVPLTDIQVFIIVLDSETYVKAGGSPVTVVHYYVGIGQADSSLTMAEEPSLDRLTRIFFNNGNGRWRLCDCQYRTKMSIRATGDLDPSNTRQGELIIQSLEEAWREANQNYTGDLNIEVFAINDRSGNSGQQQEQMIQFTIIPSGGQRGVTDRDLRRPNDEVLNTNFQQYNAGLTIMDMNQSSPVTPTSDTPTVTTSTLAPEETTETPLTSQSTTVDGITDATDTIRNINGELFITGPVLPDVYSQLHDLIEDCLRTYSKPESDCCYTVFILEDENYFDDNGNPLVRVEYKFTPNTGLSVRPTVDRESMLNEVEAKLNSTAEFLANNNTVYRGPIYGPDVLYQIYLVGNIVMESYDKIAQLILEMWTKANPDCTCTYHVTVLSGERYSGRYGTWLTKIYYIVTKDDVVQSKRSTEQPSTSDLVTSFKESDSYYIVYRNTDVVSYQRHFDLITNEVVTLTSQRGIDIVTSMTKAWRQYFQSDNRRCAGIFCNVLITILRPELHYTDKGTEVSNLVYYLTINGELQRPEPYDEVSLETITTTAWSSCSCRHSCVHSVYVYGYVQYFQAVSVIHDIIGQDAGGGQMIDRHFFTDPSGNLVTKIIFKPATYTDQLPVRSPMYIKDILAQYQVEQPDPQMPLRQRYEIVIDGRVPNTSIAAVQNIITQTWKEANRDMSDDLGIVIYTLDSENYVKTDGSPVTIVHYYVSVDQVDASLTRAEEPSVDRLSQKFFNSGSFQLCGCQFTTKMTMIATGDFDPNNSSQVEIVEQSLEEAWREANQNYTGEVNVQILSISPENNDNNDNTTDSDDQEQERTIQFIVNPIGEQEGITGLDLARPGDDDINTRFDNNNAGVTIVKTDEDHDDDDDDFPWYIPFGVVLGLLLIIIIIIVFCCICRESRKRDSKYIDNNPEDFRNDNFDKEHFTMEPVVAFDNEAFRDIEQKSQATYEVQPEPDGKTEF